MVMMKSTLVTLEIDEEDDVQDDEIEDHRQGHLMQGEDDNDAIPFASALGGKALRASPPLRAPV